MDSISSDKEGKEWPVYMANMQLAGPFLFIL